jgi:large subunit ribosomal protein L24
MSRRLVLGTPHVKLSRPRFKDRKIVPFKGWKILRGDRVQVIAGKEKGQSGVVTKVLRQRNAVVVEGLNLVKKHMKGNDQVKGQIITKSAPLHVSNVMLVHPKSGKPTRVVWGVSPDGERVRLAIRDQDVHGRVAIPKPLVLKERSTLLPKERGPLDTMIEEAERRTIGEDEVRAMELGRRERLTDEEAQAAFDSLPAWSQWRTGDGAYYYFNRLSQQSQWARPDDFDGTPFVDPNIRNPMRLLGPHTHRRNRGAHRQHLYLKKVARQEEKEHHQRLREQQSRVQESS